MPADAPERDPDEDPDDEDPDDEDLDVEDPDDEDAGVPVVDVQGSYQKTLCFSSAPLDPVTSTVTLMW